MLLARLVGNRQLKDLHLMFGWKPERVSRISLVMLKAIHTNFKHLLDWNHRLLTPERLDTYCKAVASRGSPLETCWGFIDGTLREISRPIYGQESVYNGWKRMQLVEATRIAFPCTFFFFSCRCAASLTSLFCETDS
jgi:hypothetical protein